MSQYFLKENLKKKFWRRVPWYYSGQIGTSGFHGLILHFSMWQFCHMACIKWLNSLLSLYFLIIRKLINDIIWFHMVDSVENVCHEQFYYAIYWIDHPFWCMHIYYIQVCQEPCNLVALHSLIYEENLGSKFPLPHFFNNCIIKKYIFTYMGFEGYPSGSNSSSRAWH